MTNQPNVAQAEGTVGKTIRLPVPLWRRLLSYSRESGTRQQSICVEAIEQFLKRRGA